MQTIAVVLQQISIYNVRKQMKNKLPYIIVTIIVIFLLIFILLFLFEEDRNKNNETVNTPSPTTSQVSPFAIKAIDPPEDPTGKNQYIPGKRIVIDFTKAISPDGIKITVSPSIQLQIQQGSSSNQIIIVPDRSTFWTPNVTYTIVIRKDSIASDGTPLGRDVIYRIQTRLQGGV